MNRNIEQYSSPESEIENNEGKEFREIISDDAYDQEINNLSGWGRKDYIENDGKLLASLASELKDTEKDSQQREKIVDRLSLLKFNQRRTRSRGDLYEIDSINKAIDNIKEGIKQSLPYINPQEAETIRKSLDNSGF
jgi:hypothetical protein